MPNIFDTIPVAATAIPTTAALRTNLFDNIPADDSQSVEAVPKTNVFDRIPIAETSTDQSADQAPPTSRTGLGLLKFAAGVNEGIQDVTANLGQGYARLRDPGPLRDSFQNYKRAQTDALKILDNGERLNPITGQYSDGFDPLTRAQSIMAQRREIQRADARTTGEAFNAAAKDTANQFAAMKEAAPGPKVMGTAGQYVGNTAAMMAPGAIPFVGPVVGPGVAGVASFNDTYNQAFQSFKQQGWNDAEAEAKAREVALRTGTGTGIIFATPLGQLAALPESMLSRILANAGIGGGQMALDTVQSQIQAQASYNPNLTLSDILKSAGQSFATGAAISGLMHTGQELMPVPSAVDTPDATQTKSTGNSTPQNIFDLIPSGLPAIEPGADQTRIPGTDSLLDQVHGKENTEAAPAKNPVNPVNPVSTSPDSVPPARGLTDLAAVAQDLQAALRDNQLKPAPESNPANPADPVSSPADDFSPSEPVLPEPANLPPPPAAGTLVPPAPVASELPGEKTTPAPPISSRIRQAFDWALQNIRGVVRNQATGFDITIARSGIAKTLSGQAVGKSNSLAAHLAALRQLPQLLQQAALIESPPALKQTDSVSKTHRFVAPFDFNGQKHTVKMTVRETRQPVGKNFYTLETAEIEKPAGNISVTDSLDKSSYLSTADSGLQPKRTPEPSPVKSLSPADTVIPPATGTLKSPALTPPAPEPGPSAKMVVANLTHPRGGMTKEAIAAAITGLRQSLNNSTGLYIAQNLDALPEHLQAEPKELLQTGKLVQGFYHEGVAYLVADHIPDAATAKTVFLEEALGHAGMELLLTPQDVDQLYGLIWDGARAKAHEIAGLYGQDLNTPQGRADFVGEFVAKASAWRLEKPRLWQRVTDLLLRAAYRVSALRHIAPRLILHAQMRGLTRWAAARLSDGSISDPDHTPSTAAATAESAYSPATRSQSAASGGATSHPARHEEISSPKHRITARFNQVPRPGRNFVNKLDTLKLDTNGQLHAFGLVPLVWNTLIDGVKLGVRGGLAFPDAVDAGIAKLKAAGHPFDAEGVRAWLKNHPLLQNDQPSAALPTASKPPSAPVVKAAGLRPDEINSLRRTAHKFVQGLRGRSFVNEDTHTPILVDKRGAEKSVSFLRHPDQLHILSALPEMIRHAQYHDWAADDGSHPDVLLWHYYKVPVEVSGKIRNVTLVVRQLRDGHRFYDSHFYEGNKPGPAGGSVESTKGGQTFARKESTPPQTGPSQSSAKSGDVNRSPTTLPLETTPSAKPVPKLLDTRRSDDLIRADTAKEFSSWPERQTAADGSNILLKNPKSKSLDERLEHLTFNNYTGQLLPQKARWLPNVLDTLQNADERRVDPQSKNRVYLRTYADGTRHAVVIQPDGAVQAGQPFTGKLITQFPWSGEGRQKDFKVEWQKKDEPRLEQSQKTPKPTPKGSLLPDARPSTSQENPAVPDESINPQHYNLTEQPAKPPKQRGSVAGVDAGTNNTSPPAAENPASDQDHAQHTADESNVPPTREQQIADLIKKVANAKEGIYEFIGRSGNVYVGQSKDLLRRLKQHLKNEKLLPQHIATIKIIEVPGGKLAREIAEQKLLNERRRTGNTENIRNPIGPNRKHLMPE